MKVAAILILGNLLVANAIPLYILETPLGKTTNEAVITFTNAKQIV
jgi:hypothetical protein